MSATFTEPQVYFDGDYLATAASVAIAHLDKKATPKKGKVPCNSERGWVGMKPGCKRAKKGTAQRVRGVQRVKRGKSRRPAKATVKKQPLTDSSPVSKGAFGKSADFNQGLALGLKRDTQAYLDEIDTINPGAGPVTQKEKDLRTGFNTGDAISIATQLGDNAHQHAKLSYQSVHGGSREYDRAVIEQHLRSKGYNQNAIDEVFNASTLNAHVYGGKYYHLKKTVRVSTVQAFGTELDDYAERILSRKDAKGDYKPVPKNKWKKLAAQEKQQEEAAIKFASARPTNFNPVTTPIKGRTAASIQKQLDKQNVGLVVTEEFSKFTTSKGRARWFTIADKQGRKIGRADRPSDLVDYLNDPMAIHNYDGDRTKRRVNQRYPSFVNAVEEATYDHIDPYYWMEAQDYKGGRDPKIRNSRRYIYAQGEHARKSGQRINRRDARALLGRAHDDGTRKLAGDYERAIAFDHKAAVKYALDQHPDLKQEYPEVVQFLRKRNHPVASMNKKADSLSPGLTLLDAIRFDSGNCGCDVCERKHRKRKKYVQTIADEHLDSGNGWLIWFGGRRTAIAVPSSHDRSSAVSSARKKLKRGNAGQVVTARRATDEEQKLLNRGDWVRTGPKGQKPGFQGMRGQGLPVKSHVDAAKKRKRYAQDIAARLVA